MSKRIKEQRECGQGHVTLIFWALNANSSKMAKDTNFKFGMHGKQESRAIAKMTMRCAPYKPMDILKILAIAACYMPHSYFK